MKRYVHHRFVVVLFTIAKIWKQLKRPSTDEWIKKIRFSAIERTRLPFATIRMGLEVMLSELSQTEEDKYQMISRICRI